MSQGFMVTKGDYSDYHVIAVFTTREGAEAFLAWYPNGTARIEDVPLDEQVQYPQGMLAYRVFFDVHGNSEAFQVDPDTVADDDSYPDFNGREKMYTHCWATDDRHAIKIANERRVQLIALGKWMPNYDDWRRARGDSK